MSYQVIARKWRPQSFDQLIGQTHISQTLTNALKNGRIPHALLFTGPRGTGKTTSARIMAKSLRCQNAKDFVPCNQCVDCEEINLGRSVDVMEIDGASNNGVDAIRELRDAVAFMPSRGKFKVYIIDEVHMLSTSAFNALLKTLEEPPSYAIFILATTEKHKILPTILSRCQIFDFKRITINDTVDHLEEIVKKEEILAEKPALQVIAQKSEGCMRDALSIMDKIVSFTNGELTYQNTLEHLNILDADYFFKLLDAMQQQDLATSMLLFDDINRKGFEGDMVLNAMAEFFRNLLVCKDEKVANLLEVVESFKDKYTSTAKKTSASYIISALNVLNEAEINYKQARNKRLHVELALIKLTYLQQALDLSDKKKVVDKAKAVQFRALKAVEVKEQVVSGKPQIIGEAKLMVEEPQQKLQTTNNKVQEQKPVIPIAATATTTSKAPSTGIKGGLSKLREKIAAENNNPGNQQKEIDPEGLKIAWQEYILKLKAATKHSVVSTFEMMECRMRSPLDFEVVVYGNIQLGFLKQEKTALLQHVQQFFKNPNINIVVQLMEEPEDLTPVERPLSTKEQFMRMAEKYPLVKDLKDRLGLELDY